ncbi:hypothetical protein Ccrd_010416 [Cynara cardunculus var. scolymus]|uniref:Uncharacterized protein n=1 Tax=Cynara cardunculus var. scolymus TaxID=59895 RepID=A0A118K6T5_CYNCS|nr:hypothetical protein Ccrd_010416 [Cynara cardunculus var. scolymus]
MTIKGKAITRQTMQSLVSQCVVGSEIIDVWSMVLNREERMRSNESLRRYFVPTDISMDAIIRDEDLNANQSINSNGINQTRLLKNVVFDLKHPSIAIIDSQIRDGKVDDIYGSSTVGLQDMMIMHLLREGHGAWKVYAEMDQDHIKTRWQLRENTVDVGVMLMRHMETFFGGDVVKWDCGLYKESTKQKRQLKDLRTKYCSKMLLNDVNIRKTSIVYDVERFIAMETSYNARKNGGARQMSRGRK